MGVSEEVSFTNRVYKWKWKLDSKSLWGFPLTDLESRVMVTTTIHC